MVDSLMIVEYGKCSVRALTTSSPLWFKSYFGLEEEPIALRRKKDDLTIPFYFLVIPNNEFQSLVSGMKVVLVFPLSHEEKVNVSASRNMVCGVRGRRESNKNCSVSWCEENISLDPTIFELSSDKTTIKVLEEGLYRIECKVTKYGERMLCGKILVNNIAKVKMYCSGQDPQDLHGISIEELCENSEISLLLHEDDPRSELLVTNSLMTDYLYVTKL